jgi:hypothetical protein
MINNQSEQITGFNRLDKYFEQLICDFKNIDYELIIKYQQ